MAEMVGSSRDRRESGATAWADGFTLVELLVVLLIIGILLAIAIPTYLSVTNSASDQAAQSDLQTALTGAKAYFDGNSQSYTGLETGFAAIDTGVSSVSAGTNSTGPHVVSLDAVNGAAVVLVSLGQGSEDCWGMVDMTSATTMLGATGPATLFFEEPGSGGALATPCQAASFTGTSKPSNVRTSLTGFSTVR